MDILFLLISNSELLMLIITTIYVIATVLIYKANNNSVKAAYKQIEEMRVQYDDEKRMKLMPYFAVRIVTEPEFINGEESYYIGNRKDLDIVPIIIYLEVENLGHDIAKDLKYEWLYAEYIQNYTYHIVSIAVKEKRYLKINFYIQDNGVLPSIFSVKCRATYNDLLNNTYEQECDIYFSKNKGAVELHSYSTTAPCLVKQVFN